MIQQREIRTLMQLLAKRNKLRAQLSSLDKIVNASEKVILERLREKENVEQGRWTVGILMKRIFLAPFKTICLEHLSEVELQKRVDEIGYGIKESLVVTERVGVEAKEKVK